MSMFSDLLQKTSSGEDRTRRKQAADTKSILDEARTAYIQRITSEGISNLDAQDLIALAAIVEDQPAEPPLGSARFLVALAILLFTFAVLIFGSKTAPVTGLAIFAVTERVSVKTAAESEFTVADTPAIETMDLLLNGTASIEPIAGNGQLLGTSCPEVGDNRNIRLEKPEGLKIAVSPGSDLSFTSSAPRGAAASWLAIAVDGKASITTAFPVQGRSPGDCASFRQDSWSTPALLTFSANPLPNLAIATPPGKDSLPATALLSGSSGFSAKVKDVRYEQASTGATTGSLTRCALLEGTIYYEQRVPWSGVAYQGQTKLEKRQCPSIDGSAAWTVRVEGTDEGNLQVSQRLDGSSGIQSLYALGPLGNRELGESYLSILKGDPGLAMLIGVATAIIANLWSLAQLLRRWLS